jgi:hypothetical protein
VSTKKNVSLTATMATSQSILAWVRALRCVMLQPNAFGNEPPLLKSVDTKPFLLYSKMMNDDRLTLKTPDQYTECCLAQINQELGMAMANSFCSSDLAESLQKIQTICTAGLQSRSYEIQKQALKDISDQAFWIQDSSLPERVQKCLELVQRHVGRGLNAEDEIARDRRQILTKMGKFR